MNRRQFLLAGAAAAVAPMLNPGPAAAPMVMGVDPAVSGSQGTAIYITSNPVHPASRLYEAWRSRSYLMFPPEDSPMYRFRVGAIYESDLAASLTEIIAETKDVIASYKPIPPAESCEADPDKVYVCFYNSDGDATWAILNSRRCCSRLVDIGLPVLFIWSYVTI